MLKKSVGKLDQGNIDKMNSIIQDYKSYENQLKKLNETIEMLKEEKISTSSNMNSKQLEISNFEKNLQEIYKTIEKFKNTKIDVSNLEVKRRTFINCSS